MTGDAKEDWILLHEGESLGPRPELRQEMIAAAGVDFYTYTTPKFLELAKQFLGLTLDTKSAQSEFEKIEKQDKQAVQAEEVQVHWPAYEYGSNISWVEPQTMWTQPPTWMQPVTARFRLPYGDYTMPADTSSKNKYFELLPVNGQTYHASTGKWKCEIVGHPNSDESDRTIYALKFEPEDRIRPTRHLKVWVSLRRLERDSDWSYRGAIFAAILKWLGTSQASGEMEQFA